MTDPITNSATERNLPTFEEACRKSPAPDLIRLVLAIANVVQRLKAREPVPPPGVRDVNVLPVNMPVRP